LLGPLSPSAFSPSGTVTTWRLNVDLVGGLTGLEVADQDDGTSEVLFHESFGDLDLRRHVVDGVDLAGLDVDDRVDDLRDEAEFDAADEALERVDGASGVDDADHPDARESHVREHLEVVGLADLVVDGVVGPDHQQRVGGLGHRPAQRGVLGDLRADLEVPGLLHRLDGVVRLGEELGDGLGERRLPAPGAP